MNLYTTIISRTRSDFQDEMNAGFHSDINGEVMSEK